MEPHELIGVYSSPSNSTLGIICIYHLFSLIHKFGTFAGIIKPVQYSRRTWLILIRVFRYGCCLRIQLLTKNTDSYMEEIQSFRNRDKTSVKY